MAKMKRSSLFATDEELGKRNDDHKPSATSQWIPKAIPSVSAWSKRRLFGGLLALCLLYVFIKNLPTDLGPAQTRYSNHMGRAYAPPNGARPFLGSNQLGNAQLRSSADAPTGPRDNLRGPAPPVEGGESILDQTTHSFDGPVRFYYLAASLHAIARTMGQEDKNKNVMFAASSLKSAGAIVPLACEMAKWKRTYVHMVLMGRDELPLNDLKTINGIDDASCPIYWHDARPDYAIYSTDHRMEVSISGALKHIHQFMHPQAIITAGSLHEDAFFTRAMRHKTKELRQTLIQLPQEKPDQMSWLTRLDAASLSAWHTATVDLLVQAPPETSGSLIRLLKSLAAAEYDGFEPPRLTIELPANVNEVTSRYLDGFEWPPAAFASHLRNSQLVLRRRIPEARVDAEHASVRFIESFYPADEANSHVLVLSPQAQLSPVFFHTLKYYLLEYKYSESAWMFGGNIFGISLDSPSTHLNGSAAFEPPVVTVDGHKVNGLALYLWQAPNSNAALYFADKWVELHSFLTKHLVAVKHPKTKAYLASRPKLISSNNPSWAERFLDLMRARGYYMLYPSLPADPSDASDQASTPAESLVVVHNELYRPPEEYSSQPASNKQHVPAEELAADAILDVPADYLASHNAPKSGSNSLNKESPLLKNLRAMVPEVPDDEDEAGHQHDEEDTVAAGNGPRPLPMPYSLPLIDYKGNSVSIDNMIKWAKGIAADYRENAGGCPPEVAGEIFPLPGSHDANDLFCVKESDVPATHEKPRSPPPTPNNGPADASDEAPFYGAEHRPTGAAANINAATDAAAYQETALAGMKARFEAQMAAAKEAAAEFHVPSATDPDEVVSNAQALTPAERAELDDWGRAKSKGIGEKPPPDAKGGAEMGEMDAKPRQDADKPGRPRGWTGWDQGGADESARAAHKAIPVVDDEPTTGGKLGRIKGWDIGGLDEAAPRVAKAQAEKVAVAASNAAIAAGGSTEGGDEFRRRMKLELDASGNNGVGDVEKAAAAALGAAGLRQPDAEADEAQRAVEDELRKLSDRARQIEDQDRGV